jgi:hypothetical protein
VNENVANNARTKQSSCCTVNEHMVNMAASRKATKNIDNAISSEQTEGSDTAEISYTRLRNQTRNQEITREISEF